MNTSLSLLFLSILEQIGQDSLDILNKTLGDVEGYIEAKCSDGKYINLFNDEVIIVKDGKLQLHTEPVIIKEVKA